MSSNQLQFQEWLAKEASSEKFSSMWKVLIQDFKNTGEDIFSPNSNRSYNFISVEKESVPRNFFKIFLRLNYLFTKVLRRLRDKCWENNVKFLGNYPSAEHFLKKNNLFQGYIEFCEKFSFTRYNSNSIKCYYCSTVAGKYLKGSDLKFLEIGAGTGCTAAYLSNSNDISQYVVIDLPHMIQVSSTTLKKIFPDKDQYFIFPGSDIKIQDNKPGFYFVTIDCLDEIPKDFFDMAMNLDSLQEMTLEQVDGYIKLIQNSVKDGGHFYNLNRRKQLVDENYDNNPLTYNYFPDNKVIEWDIDPYFYNTFNLNQVRIDGWIKRIEEIRK